MLGGISRWGETPVYNDEGMPDILEILQTLDPVLVFSLLWSTTAGNGYTLAETWHAQNKNM